MTSQQITLYSWISRGVAVAGTLSAFWGGLGTAGGRAAVVLAVVGGFAAGYFEAVSRRPAA